MKNYALINKNNLSFNIFPDCFKRGRRITQENIFHLHTIILFYTFLLNFMVIWPIEAKTLLLCQDHPRSWVQILTTFEKH